MHNMMNPVYIDTAKLASIGFSNTEIQNLQYLYNNGAKFTSQALQSYGYTFEQSKRLMYAYNICIGKVQVDSKQEAIKHLKKMFGSTYKITIQDLAVSNISTIPRVAVVGNITDAPYSIWNSKQYSGKDALYPVIETSGQKITIETPRKPKLAYGAAKVIPGVLEIKGVKNNGNAVVTFDKKYCKVCNRFIIVASLRNPEFHHGKYEMICFEGTKIYVYATNIGTRESARYSMGNQRVYDYGIFENEIKPKLDKTAKGIYQYLHGVSAQYIAATQKYELLSKPQENNSDDVVWE